MATGSITTIVTGGSGNYNYRVVGPVTKPFTSSNTITGLSAGYYRVIVEDVNNNCTVFRDSVMVPGTYQDPRFQLSRNNVSCRGNDGSIALVDQQFGRAPFTYSIIAPSPSLVGTSNTTGSFSNLVAGEYYVQLQDSCGGIQVRRVTIETYSWWFDNSVVNRIGCDSAEATITLRNNQGNINTTTTGYNGFTYGVVRAPGDTIWSANRTFRFHIGTRRSVTLLAKDNCGFLHSSFWTLPSNMRPSVGSVNLSNYGCTTFAATVSNQQNLTNPVFCLLNSSGNTVSCNNTGTFPSMAYGSYCIRIIDACYDTTITRCFTATKPVPSVASTVTLTNQNCTSFTASVHGWSNLTSPQFCLFDAGGTQLSCNTSGSFNNLAYGSYCIRVRNGCNDTTITRCFVASRPAASLNQPTISGVTCTSFNVNVTGNNLTGPATYCLYDSQGNVDTCNTTGVFTGIATGNYCIRAVSACGDSTNTVCFTGSYPRPVLGASVQTSNADCNGFTATITGQQNLTNPRYCLLNASNDTIGCNSTGVFTSIPYGSYCITMKDGCADTTIIRCFSQSQVQPSINSTLQASNMTCSRLTVRATGNNLTDPKYCIRDSLGYVVECNTTGIFNNLAYGRYCVTITDGCVDTSFSVCQSFYPNNRITLTTSKACAIGTANLDVQFTSPDGPFNVKVYHPNGGLLKDSTASSNLVRLSVPGLTAGLQYKVVGTNGCGLKDSAYVVPDATIVTKSASVQAKCPSASWMNGSGDIRATCSSNLYSVIPGIIRKNGSAYSQGFAYQSNGTYTFTDLEPATYVVEYTLQTCNSRVYDTVTVSAYVYPNQGQSAIYQCDNNSFSVGANVQGGISPYSYQIIGSVPSTPSIVSIQQNNPVFNISNGTTYSLVRLRTIDACGNATLADVSVLPLQNISITPNRNCFYRNVTLTVDTIANATYTWYRKTTAVDSVIIGTGLSYNLPFFIPEQTGIYICKVNVNNGCMIRIASFNLDGDCDITILPLSWNLAGRVSGNTNKLSWTVRDERDVVSYEVERRTGSSFMPLGRATATNQGITALYHFIDQNPAPGVNQYRVKMILANGRTKYSNTIILTSGQASITVYPNPVKQHLNIEINSTLRSDYQVELISSSGQKVISGSLKNVLQTTLVYNRNNLPSGVYFLKVKNMNSGFEEIRKIVLE